MDDDTLSAARAVVRGEAGEVDARFLGEIIPRVYCAYYEAADAAARDLLLASLSNWSLIKSWAWEALLEILRAHRARREPVPAVLSEWVETVALGERKPCRGRRGRQACELGRAPAEEEETGPSTQVLEPRHRDGCHPGHGVSSVI